MKAILTAIAIAFASISITACEEEKSPHIFKAEELEVQAEVLEAQAADHETAIKNLIEELTGYANDETDTFSPLAKRRLKKIEAGEHSEVNAHQYHSNRLRAEAHYLREQAAIHRRKAVEQ